MKTKNIKNILIDFDKSLVAEKINPGNEITLYSRGQEDKLANDYNIFTIPDYNIYSLYLDLSNEIKNFVLDNNLSFNRLALYCYARPLRTKSNDYFLSLSPKNKTSFFAILNISDESKYYYNNKSKEEIKPSELKIMSYLDEIKFDKDIEQFDIIYISIASVDTLHNQLPNLWVPLI